MTRCWVIVWLGALLLMFGNTCTCCGYSITTINRGGDESLNIRHFRPSVATEKYLCTFSSTVSMIRKTFRCSLLTDSLSLSARRNVNVQLTGLSLQSANSNDFDDGESISDDDKTYPNDAAGDLSSSSSSKEMWQNFNDIAAKRLSFDVLSDPANDPLAELAAENAQNEFLNAMETVKREYEAAKKDLGSDGAVEFMLDRLRQEEDEEDTNESNERKNRDTDDVQDAFQ